VKAKYKDEQKTNRKMKAKYKDKKKKMSITGRALSSSGPWFRRTIGTIGSEVLTETSMKMAESSRLCLL
jgi:hypothetical protein